MKVYICDTPIEILVALQAHDRESHLKPLPTPDLAQFSTRLADFILRDSASIACKTRTTLTELLGDDKTPLSEVLSPTLVVTTLEGSYGCHYRISDSVADMIFMSRSIWEQWQAALTRQTKDFHALQVVVTATILHEIAHRCISLKVGTVDRRLTLINEAVAQFGLTSQQTQALEKRRLRELELKRTPERLRVPWLPCSEAGQYVEWRIFGGILGWDRLRQQAYIEVGANNRQVLSEGMAGRGAQELLLDYVEEYGLLDSISPSPSTAATALTRKPIHGADTRQTLICTGIGWVVSDVELTAKVADGLRDMANAELEAVATSEQAQAKLHDNPVANGVAGQTRFAMGAEPQMLSGDHDGDWVGECEEAR